jgi:predicted dehydrogenase
LQTVNVGIIGLGFAGTRLHLPPLLQNPHVSVVWACDDNSTLTEGLRHNHPELHAIRTTTNWKELIDDAAVQAVFIATPTPTHKELAKYALAAGKHVFCEKPVALNMQDAMEMHTTADTIGKMLMIGQVLRFWPDYVDAHNLVVSGQIGDVSIARTSRAVGMPSGWYANEEHSGGVILDLALHDIDFLTWTLGDVVSVYAQGQNCTGKGTADFVDYAQIHLNFASGAIAHVEASWAVPANHPFTTSLEMCGSKGMIQMDNSDQNTSLELYPPSGAASKAAPIEYNGYFHEINAFVQAIINNETRAPIDVADVLHPLDVALAAKQSIRTGKLVNIEVRSDDSLRAGKFCARSLRRLRLFP